MTRVCHQGLERHSRRVDAPNGRSKSARPDISLRLHPLIRRWASQIPARTSPVCQAVPRAWRARPGRAKPPRNWEPDRRSVVMPASGHRTVMCGRAGRCYAGRAVERSSARLSRPCDSVLSSDCPRPRWRALAFTGGTSMSRSILLLPRGPDHPLGTIPVCFASSAARSLGTAW